MRRIEYSCALALALIAAATLRAQTNTTTVLIVLKDQPQNQILTEVQSPQTQSVPNLLAARTAFAAAVQAAVADQQNQVAQQLSSLGASNIVQHSVINALSATLPASAVNALNANSAVAQVVPQTALSLFKLLDQTVTSTADTSLSAILDAAMSDTLSQIVDDIVDRYHLTLVLRGPPGSGQNEITVAPTTPPTAQQAPDFILSDPTAQSVTQALSTLQGAGVLDPLATRALLINTADSNGWSPALGWGNVDPNAISALTGQPSANPLCADQTKATGTTASSCWTGALTNQQSYSTDGSAPAKITLTWNRHIASDGTPVLNNIALHILDKATGNEIATSASAGENVQQVTASGNSGLTVKVQLNGQLQAGVTAEPFALASSSPLTTNPLCNPQFFGFIPPSKNFPAAGGSEVVNITSTGGCTWTLGPAPNTTSVFVVGIGTTLTAPPNPLSTPRTETLMFNLDGSPGPTFSVTQDPASSVCSFAAAASGSLQFGYAGGPGSISISATPSTCAYTVTSSADWLTLNGTNGAFNVAANLQRNASTPTRTATVTVNGNSSSGAVIYTQPFTITQSGLTCIFTPQPPIRDIPAAGTPAQSFTLATSNSACEWTAVTTSPGTSTTPGLVVQTRGVQTGTGPVTYYGSSANNTGAPITDYISVGGSTVDVIQKAGNTPPPPPPTFDATVTAVVDGDFNTSVPLGENNINVYMYAGVNLQGPVQGLKITPGDPLTISGLIVGKDYKVQLTGLDPKQYKIVGDISQLCTQDAPNLTFHLMKVIPDGQRKVTVTVTDACGLPVPYAALNVQPADLGDVTNQDGKWAFLLPNAQKGNETVTIIYAGLTFTPDKKPITPKDMSVTFTSTDKGCVKGSILLDGKDVQSSLSADQAASITIAADPPVDRARVTSTGVWGADGLTDGTTYTFTFSSQKLNLNPSEVKVTAPVKTNPKIIATIKK